MLEFFLHLLLNIAVNSQYYFTFENAFVLKLTFGKQKNCQVRRLDWAAPLAEHGTAAVSQT